jgi:hypothetical protein
MKVRWEFLAWFLAALTGAAVFAVVRTGGGNLVAQIVSCWSVCVLGGIVAADTISTIERRRRPKVKPFAVEMCGLGEGEKPYIKLSYALTPGITALESMLEEQLKP